MTTKTETTPAAPAKPAAKPSKAAIKAAAKRMAAEVRASGAVTAPPAAPEASATPEPEAKPVPPPVSHFLMFVGDAFYTREDFVNEAATLGVSKRLPSYRLPTDLQVGKSRIYLVAGGKRKGKVEAGATEAPASEVFGFFTPDAIEFIAGEDGDSVYADILGYVKAREADGWRVVKSTKGEAPRKCGYRKTGGTYLVAKGAGETASPIVLLDPIAPYRGNHFRGMMRLSAEQAAAIESGAGLDVLHKANCEECGEEMLVSPDSIKRAAREDRRVEKGEAKKWRIVCRSCAAALRAAAKAAEAAPAPDAEATEATVVEGAEEASAAS